jgi:hypothetical protein
MRTALLPLLALVLASLGAAAWADAPLDARLGLSHDQARQVNAIQAEHRRAFASKRQAFNRESRALRRAHLDHDSGEIARLEALTDAMRTELTAMRAAEDEAIRRLLTPQQSIAFEDYIAERRQMRGSSRDEREF